MGGYCFISTTGSPNAWTPKSENSAAPFEGASSGNCALVLARDGNRYPIDLNTVTAEGSTFKAAYNDPGDGDEVTMEATRTADELKGTWKADGGASTGTWHMKREGK